MPAQERNTGPASFNLVVAIILLLLVGIEQADSRSLSCSPSAGTVVLNEINTAGSPDYVELYFLSDITIAANSWYLWVDGSRRAAIPAGSYAAGDFLVINVNLHPVRQEIMLVSTAADPPSSGADVVVDYLGYSFLWLFWPNWSVPASCGNVYTAHLPWQKVIDRLPDGTGGWADHGNYSTPGARNDGGASSCALGSFSVQAPAYALACPNTRATVSVTAHCTDGTIKSDYAGTVSLNLDQVSAAVYTASTGGSSVNEITFDGTEGGSQTIYVYDNDEHVTVLTASDGAASGSDSIDFRAYGFLVSSISATNACTASNLTLTAYGQNSTASGCAVIEGFAGSKTLKAWFDYIQPNTNAGGAPVVLTDTAGNRSLSTTQPAGDNIDLSFASGVASLPFWYADAGQLQLNFRHDQAPYDGSEFSPMLASSNIFTVVPAEFGLRAYTMPDDLDLNNGTDSGTPRWPAGNDFRMQIQAQCADGTMLSNYQPTAAQMWVEMVLPGGMHPGTLTLKGNNYLSTYAAPASWSNVSTLFADGIVADGPLDYSVARFTEVGVFRLHVRDANYLGEAIAEQVLTVGRFTPSYLQVTSTVDGQLQSACYTGFTCTGEAISYATQPALTLTARNAQGDTTQNYTGSFMKLTDSDGGAVGFTPPTADASQLGMDAATATDLVAVLHANLSDLVDHGDGSVTYPLSMLDSFTYTRNANAQVGAYTSDIDLVLAAIRDGDGVIDDGTAVTLQPTGTEIRFCRLVVDDAYGPQTDDLTLRVRAEYYDGGGFTDNTDDYCTLIAPTSALSLSNWQGNLASGDTSVSNTSGLLAGSGEIILSAPGIGSGSDTNDGSVEVTLNLATTSPAQFWLLNDEDGDGAFSEHPIGTASFGMYRGDDRFLYWRETQ